MVFIGLLVLVLGLLLMIRGIFILAIVGGLLSRFNYVSEDESADMRWAFTLAVPGVLLSIVGFFLFLGTYPEWVVPPPPVYQNPLIVGSVIGIVILLVILGKLVCSQPKSDQPGFPSQEVED